MRIDRTNRKYRKALVFLNGEKLWGVHWVDDETGEALITQRDAQGKCIVVDGVVQTKIVRGEIKIEFAS